MIATIIILFFHVIALGIHIAKDGEERRTEYSAIWQLCALIIIFILYYYAGLFDKFLT